MKPFLLTWNAAQTIVLQTHLLEYLDTKREVRNWHTPFLGTILVVAGDGQTATSLAAMIRSRFPGLRFAVTPLESSSTDGWMPGVFWDLIREPKTSGRWPDDSLQGTLASLMGARKPDYALPSLADILAQKKK